MPKVKTLFLVDDDVDDQDIFKEALHSIDPTITLITAYNGEDALNKLNDMGKKLPCLIFLDLNMPKMNGKEFLREIKKSDAYRDIPVVVYSTSSTEADRQETTNLGASGFVVKPNGYEKLCHIIRESIEKDWTVEVES